MEIVYFATNPPSVYKKILGLKLSLFALLTVKSEYLVSHLIASIAACR